MISYPKEEFEVFEGDNTPSGNPKANYGLNEESQKYFLNLSDADKQEIFENSGILAQLSTSKSEHEKINAELSSFQKDNEKLNQQIELLKTKQNGKDADYQRELEEVVNKAVSDSQNAFVAEHEKRVNAESNLEKMQLKYNDDLEVIQLTRLITDECMKLDGIPEAIQSNVVTPLLQKNKHGKRRVNLKDGKLEILDQTLTAEIKNGSLTGIIQSEFKEGTAYFAFQAMKGSGGSAPQYGGNSQTNIEQQKSELSKLIASGSDFARQMFLTAQINKQV